jgi:hypothetical protein
VEFDPAATCPTWEAFLNRIMGGNEDLISVHHFLGSQIGGDERFALRQK